MIMNLSRTDYLYLHVLMHDLMEMSTETKHYYIYYTNFTVHVLHLALDCADVFFFFRYSCQPCVFLHFGEVFACQFRSENSLHGPQQGLWSASTVNGVVFSATFCVP